MSRAASSLADSSPLLNWTARRADWKRALLSGSERLHRCLSAGGEPPWAELRREIALPLLRGLESGQPVVEGWFCFLLLNSPAVRHLLRVQLLERLTATGVYHDLADLPEVTGSSVAALLAESVSWSGPEAECLFALVERAISAEQLSPPNSADAIFLAVSLPGPPADSPRPSAGSHGADLLATAAWIRQFPDKNGTGSLHSSALFREWLKTAAFRGLRRSWSRSSGHRAGLQHCQEIPFPLQPTQGHPLLPEGFGVMLVEWALACLRTWPDRERLVEENHAEIQERAHALLTSVRRCLARVEHADRLNAWLETGAAELLSPPGSRHRLRTSPPRNPASLWI
jgi:hypothetical protein